MNSLPIVESLWRDVRYALRQMKKSPGLAATVVLTLALGIGAAAAMFTVVDHVLLQPVPYKNPGRLVRVQAVHGGVSENASWLDIQQWEQRDHSLKQIAFSGAVSVGRQYIERKSVALEVRASQVTSNLFSTLGVQPAIGRGFLPEQPGFVPGRNAGTVVLSHAVWQRAFGGEKDIVGREIRINKTSYTVVGVMPRGFEYPAGNERFGQVWFPIQLTKQDQKADWSSARWHVIARLRRNVSLSAAEAELASIQQSVVKHYGTPRMRRFFRHVRIERYASTLADVHVRKALWALFGAAGLLWLIANLNVTNLLLARSMTRQREIAMRGALGASRGRLVQQMAVEGLLLSGAASLLGFGLAVSAVKLMQHELAAQLPLPVPAMPDLWVVAVLLGLTMVSALISSAWPTLLAVCAPMEPALRQGNVQSGTGRRHHRMRGALVAAEIAMSLTLLVACGLLLRTLYVLRHVPLGYRTDHIVVAHLSIPSYRYSGQNMTTELYEPLLEQVKHLRGVEYAGLTTRVPLAHTYTDEIGLRANGKATYTLFQAATPGVQKVFGFQMAAGRYFGPQDVPGSPPAIVVNRAFARAYSPKAHDPSAILGTKLMGSERGDEQHASAEVVGVLDDARQNSAADASQPEIELCLCQIAPGNMFYREMDGVAMDLAIRTRTPSARMIPELRDVLKRTDPELANSTITTMDEIVADSYGSQRLAAHLLEVFGGVALLLCVAGLYGLLAYVVSQQMRELGVRVALGAQRGDLIWMVMRQAGGMLAVGIATGCGLAWVSAAVIRGFLYGVAAHNGWVLTGASLLMLASGLLAAYLPARRAASVDPMRVLRME